MELEKEILSVSPPPSHTSQVPQRVRLKKRINLLQGVSVIVGIIIGAGIFVSPVGILRNVKSVGLSLVMWLVCGVFNTLCALCYAELGTTISASGGEYAYVMKAFGDFPAFVCLWINCLLICPVGLAASSLIFATYILQPIFDSCEIPPIGIRLVAAIIIMLLITVNTFNVNWATRVQVIITGSKLIALAMIIIIGFVWIGKGDVTSFSNMMDGSDFAAGSIALSFYSGFWAFGGWSYLNFLTDELIDPHKNLPRAILISMSIVTVVYLVANVAYFAVLTPVEMLHSSAVAVLVLTLLLQCFGDIFFLIEMEGFAFAAILSSVFAGQVYLRVKQPDLVRPIKLPLVLPTILVVICLSICALTVYQKPWESVGAIGVMMVSLPVYIFAVKWKNKPKSVVDILENTTKLLQKLLMVVMTESDGEVK
ncbi:large neutral amino acids transporter small subunit 1-like isoform X2 [Liolophura sinensis]|uniref:large neutral amino acids transporter small subunit 1-like isoform X2 n=1 Tax=Liolophura sinensis TaxID=3198878 RepID=UPI0031580A1E